MYILEKVNVLKGAILRGILLGVLVVKMTSCFVMEGKYPTVAPGIWRAELELAAKQVVASQNNEIHSVRQLLTTKNKTLPDNIKMEEANEGSLPFLFEVKYTKDSAFTIDIINGEERIPVAADEIKVWHNKQNGLDSILINFPVFGSQIKAVYRERIMEGEFVVPAKKVAYPFVARYGQNHRFTTLAKPPKADLTGKWACNFDLASEKPYAAIGEFTQNGNLLRGTFRTETGDYRFLDGEVQADKFYLSCFDGSHTFIFEGKIRADGNLDGFFRSGKGTPEVWEGTKNDKFELKNANELTKAVNSAESINFTFPDASGKQITLNDYAGKVKVIQIMGTWCPNCRDETNFLRDYVKNKPNDKLAVIALAFERNAEIATTQVTTYKQKMAVPYDILIGGTTTNKAETSKKLPWLDKISAYPTMVFVDKKNIIRRIHTGFDGPATSKYADFTKEFDNFVNELIKE